MRTTLTVDDDVYAAARELAAHRGVPIGQVISELSRAGLEARRTPIRRVGRVPTFPAPAGARPVTSDMVYDALDDE